MEVADVRRVQIDVMIAYVDELDEVIDELKQLRSELPRKKGKKSKKPKKPKQRPLLDKEYLTWEDIFKVLSRHYGQLGTEPLLTRRTSNLMGMFERLIRFGLLPFEVRCVSCGNYALTVNGEHPHAGVCPDQKSPIKRRTVTRRTVLANAEAFEQLGPVDGIGEGRRADYAVLLKALSVKAK